MNTVKGAAGMLLIVLGFYLCPHDVAFRALGGSQQILVVFGLLAFLWGGIATIALSIVCEIRTKDKSK